METMRASSPFPRPVGRAAVATKTIITTTGAAASVIIIASHRSLAAAAVVKAATLWGQSHSRALVSPHQRGSRRVCLNPHAGALCSGSAVGFSASKCLTREDSHQNQRVSSTSLFSFEKQLVQLRLLSSAAASKSCLAAARIRSVYTPVTTTRFAPDVSLSCGTHQPSTAGYAACPAASVTTTGPTPSTTTMSTHDTSSSSSTTGGGVTDTAAATSSELGACSGAAVPAVTEEALLKRSSSRLLQGEWRREQQSHTWTVAQTASATAATRGSGSSVQLPPWGLSWLLPSFSRSKRVGPAATKRQHVVILGTGWASVNFFRFLDPDLYDITIISPRNYFTFTPLLPSVCAGTLSPLACIEPVRALIQEGARQSSTEFYEAHCTDIDFAKRLVSCDSGLGGRFHVHYDYLVIAVGSEVNTFGVRDVAKHAFFLREVEHAMLIRKQVMNNFEQAALPRGGPTGVESAAEFADFIREDMSRCFPQLVPFVSVTLIEGGGRLLPTYSPDISAFAERVLTDRLHVKLLLRSIVTHVDATTLQFSISASDGKKETRTLSHGFVLWASGVGQVPLVKKLLQRQQEKEKEEEEQEARKTQRTQNHPSVNKGSINQLAAAPQSKKPFRGLPVDAQLRLIGQSRVYAIGDCAVLTPPRLEDDAAELYSRSGPNQPGVRWLESQAAKLQDIYPQLSTLKFDYSQLKNQRDAQLSFEQFKQLLGRIDAAYQPPAPTAQNARQEGLYLSAVFNAFPEISTRGAAPAFKETWNGSLAYVGGLHADADYVAQSHDLPFRLAEDILRGTRRWERPPVLSELRLTERFYVCARGCVTWVFITRKKTRPRRSTRPLYLQTCLC